MLAGHDAADAGNQFGLFGDGHDAGRGSHHVHHIARRHPAPMASQCASKAPTGIGNARAQAQLLGPLRAERARDGRLVE